jgi:hypothetical protein
MAVKVPTVGQLAFRGNVRRAIQKFGEAAASLAAFQAHHPQWPVQLLSIRQLNLLAGLVSSLDQARILRVPAPPQT